MIFFVLVETFKCKLCNASYKQRGDFLHHIQTVHKPTLYSCSLCPCQLNSPNELSDHLKFIHKINQNIDLHTNHRRPSFNALFPCAFCSIRFNSRFDLNQHILHEHNDDRRNSLPDWHQNGKKSCKSNDCISKLISLLTKLMLLSRHIKNRHDVWNFQNIPSVITSSNLKVITLKQIPV
jgi:hypothetical protein